jgi:nicotinamidase-related amidase
MTNTALLMIDVQRNMFELEPAVADGLDLLVSLAGLITRARAARAPVIFVRNCGGAGDPDEPGTTGWELSPALPRQAGDPIVDKKKPDAFEGTNLQTLLKARGVRQLVIAGLQSEFCVQATCRGAHARGYSVMLASDAHGTYDGADGGPSALDIIARENAALVADEVVELVAGERVMFG